MTRALRPRLALGGLAALGLAALAGGQVIAQGVVSPLVAQRKALLKAQGEATGPIGGMLRGQAPFDLARVQVSLAAYVETAQKLKTMFPEDSRTGGETGALPAIWERKPEFDALMTKFERDSAAAIDKIKDEASFKATMPGVLQNCGACHNAFRVKT